MNLFKTALKNIKKSGRDYSVYFFTLIVAVSIFYMFNSISSQPLLKGILTASAGIAGKLSSIIEVISVGVAIVFGILMIYAGNFIIRRRKKEFGIYMMLGMGRKKVAKLLVIETLLVGIISLAVGLIFGIFGSQLLSIIVCKMFEIDMSGFTFSLSASALGKTIINFAVIFVVVLMFNARAIGKYKLIDLFSASRKNERKIIGTIPGFILLTLSLAALITAYVNISLRGDRLGKYEFFLSIILGFVGTFMLFISLSGVLPHLLKSNKKFYHKGLNSFITRQFCSNINTSAISFSIICLLLFVAISAFSVGFSMNSYINRRLGNSTPVDISLRIAGERTTDLLTAAGTDAASTMGEYIELPVYESQYITSASSVSAAMDLATQTFMHADWNATDYVMKLSDYNALERMYGRDELVLSDNQYADICDFDLLTRVANEAIKNGNTIIIGEYSLQSGYDACLEEFVLMSGLSASMGVIVVPDCVVETYPDDFTVTNYLFIGNYKDSSLETREKTDALFDRIINDEAINSALATKTLIEQNNAGTSVSAVFIVLYIGIVFVITGAAVIALKILSDSIDSIPKFEILDRVGAGRAQRSKALLVQILLNFLLPLIPAVIHSVFGLQYISGLMHAFGMEKMTSGIGMSAAIMLLLYGGYFLITNICCQKIVLDKR